MAEKVTQRVFFSINKILWQLIRVTLLPNFRHFWHKQYILQCKTYAIRGHWLYCQTNYWPRLFLWRTIGQRMMANMSGDACWAHCTVRVIRRVLRQTGVVFMTCFISTLHDQRTVPQQTWVQDNILTPRLHHLYGHLGQILLIIAGSDRNLPLSI